MSSPPPPFEVVADGMFLHGTKAVLNPGELLVPGRASNFETRRTMRHVYITETLDTAAWGAELAAGDAQGRIYVVEPTGQLEDDPNVTDMRVPGNPTRSYRTRQPVCVIRELSGWVGHTPETSEAMRDGLDELRRSGEAEIQD